MALFILSALSIAFASKSPGDCCVRSNLWGRDLNDCDECQFGHVDSFGDVASGCGWANWAALGGFLFGECKQPPKPPGTGSLAEGSCCVASGISWSGVRCEEDCPYGWTNDILDVTSECGWLNTVTTVGLTVIGKCTYRPDEVGMNDAYLTSRLMQMAIAKRHFNAGAFPNAIDGSSVEQFLEDYNALRELGYTLESYNIEHDSYHVIEAPRTETFGEHGAHIVYFYAEHGGNTELVIAFPGSATTHDWVSTNSQLALFGSGDQKCFYIEGEKFCGGKTVVEHYETTRDQFLREMGELLDQSCVSSCVDVIRVLGHSLGGSAAQFGAIDMAKKFAGKYKIWLSTYASVRALAPSSSDKAQSLLTSNGNWAMRFMLYGDIVPYTGAGLRHIGNAYLINKAVLYPKDRDYMPTDATALKCCPLCPITKTVVSALSFAYTAWECLLGSHVMYQYIYEINLIKNNNMHYLDQGRVPSRAVMRRCSAFPPLCSNGESGVFAVASGGAYCQVDMSDMNCVTDGAGVYGYSEDCTIIVQTDGIISAKAGFSIEHHSSCAYDYLEINGVKYCGTNSPDAVQVSTGDTITWHSDGTVTNDGWTICLDEIKACDPGYTPVTHDYAPCETLSYPSIDFDLAPDSWTTVSGIPGEAGSQITLRMTSDSRMSLILMDMDGMKITGDEDSVFTTPGMYDYNGIELLWGGSSPGETTLRMTGSFHGLGLTFGVRTYSEGGIGGVIIEFPVAWPCGTVTECEDIDCATECTAAEYGCTDLQSGVNQHLSCTQACDLRKNGMKLDVCIASCQRTSSSGCSFEFESHSYNLCGECPVAIKQWWENSLFVQECEYGCNLLNQAGPSSDPGLYEQKYIDYFLDNFSFFDTATTDGAETTVTSISKGDEGSNYSYQWWGYFCPSETGTYQFKTASDDASFVLIAGSTIVDNGGTHGTNTVSASYEVTDTSQCQEVRIYFGELGGGANMAFWFQTPSTSSWVTDFSSIFFTEEAGSGENDISNNRRSLFEISNGRKSLPSIEELRKL